MNKKFFLFTMFLSLGIFCCTGIAFAEDAEVKLNSNNGSTGFIIQDSDAVTVWMADSDGNALVKGTMTVQGNAFSVGNSTFVVTGGNVGIGTTGPGQKLDVQGGNINTSGNLLASGVLTVSGTGNSSIAGNVGIGTTGPNAKLQINGDILVDDNSDGYTFVTVDRYNSEFNSGFRFSTAGTNDFLIHEYDNPGKLEIANGNVSARYLTILNTGNVGIGTTNPGGGTGSSVLSLANTSAAPTALAGVTHLYSSVGEGYWMDAAGNATLQTPHDSVTGEWIFYSKNIKTGKVLRVNMEKLVKFIDEKFGTDFVKEFTITEIEGKLNYR